MQYCTIKPATQNDLPQVIKMLEILAAQESMQNQLCEAKLRQVMQSNQPKLEVLIAEHEAKIIGCILFYMGFDVLSASYGAHISDIFVLQEHRKHKVGSQLLAAVAKQVLTQNGVWLSWTVDKNNKSAKQFYHNLGAVHVDADFMAIGETGLKNLNDMFFVENNN
jgi:GNAT superfamily N-acetyltransferase